MREAEFIRKTNEKSQYGGLVKIYKCKNCRVEFSVGLSWFNCFFCCQGCADAWNRCDKCGGNRNWCECKHRDSSEGDVYL